MASFRQCFVPICKNDSKNSPDKIFVRIREDLKKDWCEQVNATYYNIYTMYCCEDHFDPRQDLKNYYQCKLMGHDAKLKPNAILRYLNENSTECKEKEEEPPSSELLRLLTLPVSPNETKKRKYSEDMNMPSTSTCSTSPIKVRNVGIQCVVKMVDKSTNYRVRKFKKLK